METNGKVYSRLLAITRRARGFPHDKRGNFTIMFGLSAVVLIVIVGMGIDYLTGLSFKSRWDTAADTAALAAVQAAQTYVSANSATLSKSALQSGAVTAGDAAGLKAFNANAGVSETTEQVTPNISLTFSGTTFSATVTYSGQVTTHFGGLVGVKTLAVSGTAAATASMKLYINYYFLVDISQSMGVGSTATDMQNLYNRTLAYGNSGDGEPGCIFGCHVTTSGQTYTNEFLAHSISPYITLRIDAAKTAIENVISTARSEASGSQNIQFAIYTMNQDPSAGVLVTPVASLSSNYSSLLTSAATIDLGNNNSGGIGDTNFTTQLNNFETNVLSPASSGNGYSSSSPLNYVFIITDGVQDVQGSSCTSGHCTQAFDSSLCTQLKTKATVGVIYTTYLPIYTDNNSAKGYDANYSALVLPFASQIPTNLQACATNSSLYYEATDGTALDTAMSALFASTQQTLALTQ